MYLLLLLFHIFVILVLFIIINNFSKKIIINLIFGSLFFSTLISIFLVYEVVYLNSFCYVELGSWFNVGSLSLTWTFYFDKLTVLMVFLILMIFNSKYIICHEANPGRHGRCPRRCLLTIL